MPKIPQYERQITPGQPVGAMPRVPAITVNPIGRELEGLGLNLERAGLSYANRQERIAELEDRGAIQDAHLALEQFNAAKQAELLTKAQSEETVANPEKFAQEFMFDFDREANELVRNTSNRKAADYLKLRTTALSAGYFKDSLSVQAHATVAKQSAGVEALRDSLGKLVAADENQYEAAMGSAEAYLSTLHPSLRQTKAGPLKESIAVATNEGFARRNPHLALPAYNKALGMKDAPPPTLPPAAQDRPAAALANVVSKVKAGPYDDIIKAAAEAAGVPAEFLRAIAWIESKFDPKAVGEQTDQGTAKGLFQFMDATAKAYGIDPFDVKQSATASAKMFAENLRRFGGDPWKAVAAHIGGPNTAKWGPKTAAYVAKARELVSPADEPPTPTQAVVGPPMAVSAQETVLASPFDTGLPFVDALSFDKVIHFRNLAESEIRKQSIGLRTELEREDQNREAAMKAGLPFPAPDFAKYAAAYAGDPATAQVKFREAQNAMEFGGHVKAMITMPPGDMEAYVDALRLKPGDESRPDLADRLMRIDGAERAQSEILNKRKTERMGALIKQGIVKFDELDTSSRAAFVAGLQQHQNAANMVNGIYLDQPDPFTPAQAAGFARVLAEAPVSKQVAMLDWLNEGLTDPAVRRRGLEMLGMSEPTYAVAGAIASKIGGKEAAETLLRGRAALHPNKAEQKEQGPGRAPFMPNETQLMDMIGKEVGNVFRGEPDGGKQAIQQIRYYYAGLASAAGTIVGEDKAPKREYVEEAVRRVLGGVYTFNGNASVQMPYGMPPDEFNARFQIKMTEALILNGMDPRNHPIEAYSPVSIGDGRYALQSGTGFLLAPPRGRGGAALPIEIHVGDWYEPMGPAAPTAVERVMQTGSPRFPAPQTLPSVGRTLGSAAWDAFDSLQQSKAAEAARAFGTAITTPPTFQQEANERAKRGESDAYTKALRGEK